MARFEMIQSLEAEALCAALPAFLAPEDLDDGPEDAACEPQPGFEPLILPLQPGTTPWTIASDGRLAAVRAPDAGD